MQTIEVELLDPEVIDLLEALQVQKRIKIRSARQVAAARFSALTERIRERATAFSSEMTEEEIQAEVELVREKMYRDELANQSHN